MIQAVDNSDSLNPHPDEAPADPAAEPVDPAVTPVGPASEPVYVPDTAMDPDPEMPAPNDPDK